MGNLLHLYLINGILRPWCNSDMVTAILALAVSLPRCAWSDTTFLQLAMRNIINGTLRHIALFDGVVETGRVSNTKNADENDIHQHNVVRVLQKLARGCSHMHLGWLC